MSIVTWTQFRRQFGWRMTTSSKLIIHRVYASNSKKAYVASSQKMMTATFKILAPTTIKSQYSSRFMSTRTCQRWKKGRLATWLRKWHSGVGCIMGITIRILIIIGCHLRELQIKLGLARNPWMTTWRSWGQAANLAMILTRIKKKKSGT